VERRQALAPSPEAPPAALGAYVDAMLAEARVGTSGFLFRDWIGAVYPQGLHPSEMLAVYARKLTTVEISLPPSRAPNPQTFAQWASAVPPGFEFALKTPHQIGRDLRAPRTALRVLEGFLGAAEELGEHLGPLLLQVPHAVEEDRTALRDFLSGVPRELRLAFEFRHPSWQNEGTLRVLSAHNAALVLADHGGGPPRIELTADFTYVRIRRDDDKGTPWEDWAERLAALTRRGIDVYSYLKHDRRGLSVERARRLAALLRTQYESSEQSLLT
jgi:uncharacterized protein YecE (DUF72 family)